MIPRELLGVVATALALGLVNPGDLPAQEAGLVGPVGPDRPLIAPEARQGVAVDRDHLYAVTNRAIGKYDRRTGERVGEWEGSEDGPIVHLNSGVVVDGRLYAAHSNYPGVPQVSSIEVWDAVTMEHVASHALGIQNGSATWVDRHDCAWWVAFASYDGRGGVPGRGVEWTELVRYDNEWRATNAWVFPAEVVERFRPYSNSGGAWGPDGQLYVTGHDAMEVYVLRLPDAGGVIALVEILPFAGRGQGIAWDPADPEVLFGVRRDTQEVVATRIALQEPQPVTGLTCGQRENVPADDVGTLGGVVRDR